MLGLVFLTATEAAVVAVDALLHITDSLDTFVSLARAPAVIVLHLKGVVACLTLNWIWAFTVVDTRDTFLAVLWAVVHLTIHPDLTLLDRSNNNTCVCVAHELLIGILALTDLGVVGTDFHLVGGDAFKAFVLVAQRTAKATLDTLPCFLDDIMLTAAEVVVVELEIAYAVIAGVLSTTLADKAGLRTGFTGVV